MAGMPAHPLRHPPRSRASVLVKSLSPNDLPALLAHFTALDLEDRHLRFGVALTDDAIARYLDRIDWTRHAVFGVYGDDLVLEGVAHLARLPASSAETGERGEVAEFGVSVLPHARGRGIGSRLFDRGVLHARTLGLEWLAMRCLAQNTAMLRIARRAGMRVHVEAGEADAVLELGAFDWRLVLEEAVEEQLAAFDLGWKRRLTAANDLAATWSRVFTSAA